MKYFRRLLQDILHFQNVELIPVVVLGLIILIFNILGIKTILGCSISDLLPSLTLIALGLLSIGLLFTRYRIEETYLFANTTDIISFESDKNTEIIENLKNSNEVLLIGINLRKTTIQYYENFIKIAKRGGYVKAVIAHPEKINICDLCDRFERGRVTPAQYLSAFDQTILQFCNIRKINEEIGIDVNAVELRAINFIPSFSLYIFPKAKGGAFAYVEIFAYKSPDGSIPKFKVSKLKNPVWYDHFLSQFNKIWDDAEPIKSRNNNKIVIG